MTNTLITVFGGTGFLGRHTVRALARAGFRVRVAVRHPNAGFFLLPMGHVGQIALFKCNVRNAKQVAAAVHGASGVVNLTGILFSRGRQNFNAVHVEGAAAIADAARAGGAASLVHISSIGANSDAESSYAASKGEGEQRVREAFPDATILRPSIVFGPEDDFFNRFAALARIAPALPLVGGGLTRMQPVFAGNVAEAIARAVDGDLPPGSVYELGGPTVHTFKELMQFVLGTTQRRRLLVPVPFALMKLQAMALQFLPKPPITPDQVELLKRDNIVSEEAKRDGRTLEGIGITPESIEAIVPTYLWRFRKTGQFNPYVA